MSLLGELGIFEAGIGCLEIGTAVLPVGVEKQRIEPPVEIIVMCNVVLGARPRIELLRMPDHVPQPPTQLGPSWQSLRLIHQDGQRVGERTMLDDEGAFHIGLAQRQFGIE